MTKEGVVVKAIYDQNNLTEHFAGHIGVGGPKEESLKSAINIVEGHTIKVGPNGEWVYVSDREGHRVLRMAVDRDYVEVIAGTGTCEPAEDILTGLPTEISLCFPTHIDFDADGNLLIVDSGHNRLRRLIFNRSDLGTTRFISEARDESSIIRKADGTLELVGADGTVMKFDDQNRYIGSLSRDGRFIDVRYDGEKIESISDNEGQLLRFGYNGDRVDAIIDRANRSTRLEIDPIDNHLSLVRFPDNTTKRYEYDSKAHLRRERDQRDNETEYFYNKFGRLARINNPDDSETTILLADDGITLNDYQDDQEPLRIPALTSLDSPVDIVTNGVGAQTKMHKDPLGRVDEIIDPVGRKIEMFYDRFNQVTRIVDPLGETTSFTYDELGRQTERRNENTGRFLKTTYNDFNQVLKREDNDGEIASYTYDEDGNQLTEANRNGLHTIRTYFSNGLLNTDTLKNADQGDIIRSFTYDGNGNTQTVSVAGEVKQSFVRDNAGNPLTTTSASSDDTLRSYDGFNRLLSVETPDNEVTFYRYLATGQLSEIEDPEGRITQFRYDALGRLLEKEDHLDRITSYQYDDAGNVIRFTDPAGQVTNMEYDFAGQLTRRVLEDNIYSYQYDDLGNLTGVENDEAFAQFAYDTEGRLTFESLRGRGLNLQTHDVAYDYDQVTGNLTEITQDYNGQQFVTTFGYLDDVISTIDAPYAMRFNYDYNNALQLTRVDRVDSSVITTRYNYDSEGLLSSTENGIGAMARNFSYQRNADNFISQFSNAGIHLDYTYDDNNQLTEVKQGASIVENFSYDNVGNRVLDGARAYTYEGVKYYLKSDGVYNYSYDANGNLKNKIHSITGVIESFEYTSENRLKRYVKQQSVGGLTLIEADYVYGPLGRRLEKRVVDHSAINDLKKSRTLRYLYVGEEPSIELNASNDVLAYHAYSGLQADDVLGTHVTATGVQYGYAAQSGNHYFYKDHIGSLRYVVNSSGSVIQTVDYSSFGKITSVKDGAGTEVGVAAPSFTLSHAFTGREYDPESGLYYYRARTYDPGTGRFLQEDPHPGVTNSPQTIFTRYSYAGSNPVNNIDPNGRFFFSTIALALTIWGGATSTAGVIALGAGIGAFGSLAVIEAQNGFDVTAGFDALRTKEGRNQVLFGALGGGLGGWIAAGISGATTAGLSANSKIIVDAALQGGFISAGSTAGFQGVDSEGRFSTQNINGDAVLAAFFLGGALNSTSAGLNIGKQLGLSEKLRVFVVLHKEGGLLLIPYQQGPEKR